VPDLGFYGINKVMLSPIVTSLCPVRVGTVKVKLQGMAQSYDAIVIGIEPEKDIAVLKIPNSSNLPTAHIIDIGTSDDLQVGQSVLAIGNPFGLDNTLTTGVVSALGRDIQGFGGRKIKGCVQTDGT
jgi:S1-C subfamily serine protease